MSRKEKSQTVQNFLEESFERVRRLPAEHVYDACDAVLQRLRSEADGMTENTDVESGRASRKRFRPVFALAAVAIAVFVVVFLQASRSDVLAVVESAEGGLHFGAGGNIANAGTRIEADEAVRTNGETGAVLKLSDGSTIEMRSNSELLLERANDGLLVRLNSGGVIVNAARQRTGHLYVETKDLQAIVVGTVFLVSASEEGSRVGVIEGDVRVRKGANERQLLPGEEVSTNPLSTSPPLKEEVSWSQHAPAHLALLQQSTPLRTTIPAQDLQVIKETFEVGSIRIGVPPPPGTGIRGGAGPNGCAGGFPAEIDPKRFAATNKYVFTLIAWAFFGNFGPCQNVSGLNLISGGPDWIKSDQFDIEAKIPDGAFTTTPTLRDPKLGRMLQSLLEERFRLVTHRETKVMDVYVMTFERDASPFVGSKDTFWLTKKPADWPAEMEQRQGYVVQEKGRTAESTTFRGFFYGANATMAEIAPLIGRLTGRPVVERTGLTAKFYYSLEYSVDSPPNNSPITGPLNPGERDSLISELQKQMGIKLEPTRAPVEVLVIDHVEKPSPN